MSQLIVEPTEDEGAEPVNLDDNPELTQEAPDATTGDEPAAKPEAKDESIPEKYRGKSLEEIIQMHQNAEKRIGEQANEVGTYREMIASFSNHKRAEDLSKGGTADEKPVEVTTDSLLDNPTEAISKVVESALEKALSPIHQNQQVARLQDDLAKLQKEHPDAEEIGNDPSFVEFVSSSPYRQADAQRWVESMDVDAARRLLTDFKQFRGVQPQEQQPEQKQTSNGVAQARKAATESGRTSSGDNQGKKTLSRREVQRIINTDRERYESPSFQRMLVKHIQEGTLVD